MSDDDLENDDLEVGEDDDTEEGLETAAEVNRFERDGADVVQVQFLRSLNN